MSICEGFMANVGPTGKPVTTSQPRTIANQSYSALPIRQSPESRSTLGESLPSRIDPHPNMDDGTSALEGQSEASLKDEAFAIMQQINEIMNYRNANYESNARNSLDHETAISVFEKEMMGRYNILNELSHVREYTRAAHLGQTSSARAEEDTQTARNIEPASTNVVEASGPSRTSIPHQTETTQTASHAETQCCVCLDQYPQHKITRLKCMHLYCNGCLKSLFLKAIKDESLFPPKCCRQSIPLCLIQNHLSAVERREFNNAVVEYEASFKTYCSNTQCLRFIPSNRVYNGQAFCSACRAMTCTICQRPAHPGECPHDPILQATLSLANMNGWRRCYSCRNMVERTKGCNHMTCRCKAEFCYMCGGRWRTCVCPESRY